MNIISKVKRYKSLLFLSQVYFQSEKLVWDLDGTLYFNPKLIDVLRKEYVHYYTGKLKRSKNNFIDLEKMGYDWSEILGETQGSKVKSLILRIENKIPKYKYIRVNRGLSHFLINNSKENLVFTNSDKEQAFDSLHKLGISNFNKALSTIITLNDLNEPKPFKKSYGTLLKVLGELSPSNVIYIGDSEKQDIKPAKEFGFTTVFLNHWGKKNIGDFNYDDINLLIHDFQKFEKIEKCGFIGYLLSSLLKNLPRF
jgi:FMN phosphatase YigB (HAD superfamily)